MGKFMRLALREALKCNTNRHRVGAVVVRGGKVVAKSHNRLTRHAEVRALAGLWPSECDGATVYVVRPTYTGGLGLARPCPDCEQELRRLGVRKIVYSTYGGHTWERL